MKPKPYTQIFCHADTFLIEDALLQFGLGAGGLFITPLQGEFFPLEKLFQSLSFKWESEFGDSN